MKIGGNASATDYFTKHGGSSLLSDSDTKKKYSGRVAELYKEELAKRVRDDVARLVCFLESMTVTNIDTHLGSRTVSLSMGQKRLPHPLLRKKMGTISLIHGPNRLHPKVLHQVHQGSLRRLSSDEPQVPSLLELQRLLRLFAPENSAGVPHD